MAMATNSRMPRVTATCVLALALAACTNSNTAPPSTQASAGPVAGLNTGCVRAASLTRWPSIKWPMVWVTDLSWFMKLLKK